MSTISALAYISLALFILGVYLYRLNSILKSQPPDALKLSPHRWTEEEIRAAYDKYVKDPIDMRKSLPPRTGNRYIVVGGSGFTGGWIVVHLLMRGEDPENIRILDIRPPTRRDLTTGLASKVQFIKTDISSLPSVEAAFSSPWPSSSSTAAPLTIFHTASNIRFYERHSHLLPRSSLVNITGTQNLLSVSRQHGAKYFIYTSSGSVSLHLVKYWLWPWERRPRGFVQVLDDLSVRPSGHGEFFSNYAETKSVAEGYVREADVRGGMRTGCVSPGNGVYGPGGDISVGAYLIRKTNPTWIENMIQSECYVENVSLAHLLFEASLIASSSPPSPSFPTPIDLGGQSFIIADPNPPVAYGDLYKALKVLGGPGISFPSLPPLFMLIFAHLVEAYYLLTTSLPSSFPIPIPRVGGDIVNLQPSLFPLTTVHIHFDDERARKLLGYKAPFTTLEGVCKLVYEHLQNGGEVEERQRSGGGVSFGFGLMKAERGVEKVGEKLGVVKLAEKRE